MQTVKGPDPDMEKRLQGWMEQYEQSLLRLCCVYLRDWDAAQDAVQETLIKAYRHYASFRGQCSEKTWLTRIAVNACKDMRRAAWYRYVDRAVLPERLPPPVCEATDAQRELTLAVMALPRRQMEAILLYYYQGLNSREIGEALGVPQRTVTARLRQGREELRALLEGEDDE